jgi:protein TonB
MKRLADEPKRHLLVAVLGSVAANLLLWIALGQGALIPVATPNMPELVFDRVAIQKTTPFEKPIVRRIEPKPKVIPAPKAAPRLPQKTSAPVSPRKSISPPSRPEGAHSRTLTAHMPDRSNEPHPFVAPKGGNAPLGAPIESQNPGSLSKNPPNPVVTQPTSAPVASPKVVEKPSAPAPPKPVISAPVSKPAPPPPPPPPPPKPTGPTREATPNHQESVEIPESMKSSSFKSFVRVRVNVTSDGSFTVVLRTSSGNTDVDKLVVDTLNRWTWKPALKNGEPVDSIQQFRFNFRVE